MLSYLEVKKMVLYVISFYFYKIVNRVQVLLGTIVELWRRSQNENCSSLL